jgi:phosphoglycerol transferase MdoB-like AlkP superfamily enzyme
MDFINQQPVPSNQTANGRGAAPEKPPRSGLKRLYLKLWPLSPLVLFYAVGLVLFTAFRAILCFSNLDRVQEVGNYLRIFPIGLKLDTVLLSYVLVLPALLLLACPLRFQKTAGTITAAYFACMAGIFYYLEVATFPFMAEFDNRPDRVFLEHMTQLREVGEMILKGYKVSLAIAVTGMLLIMAAVFSGFRKLPLAGARFTPRRRLYMSLFIAVRLVLGIRMTLLGRPVNMSAAAFSTNHFVNQLGFNSTYSLGYLYVQMKRHPDDAGAMYGRMPKEEVFQRLRTANGLKQEDCAHPELPFLRRQASGFAVDRPLNLVIIMEESFGAEYVGHLGGLPLSPYMDRLSREGVVFKNLYCTGTRTLRGIEAILMGFLPTPGASPLNRATGKENFYTIARTLKDKGYSTDFLYGGISTFDNLKACFLSNGVENIYDQSYFKNPVFTGTWGVSDEDLFRSANEVFRNHGGKPFFALVLTTSNHDPYEFPDGRIELYKEPKASRQNTIKYADYALGTFFETAKKEPYYNNTVFLIIADHSTKLHGQSLIPIQKFHIPGIIIAPHLKPAVYDKLASQIDMTPTLLDVLGITVDMPLLGRPLLHQPPGLPGRAVMQYGDMHALMVDRNIVLQQPDKKPRQFTVAGNELTPCPLDPELAKDALAYALLPDYFAAGKLYRMP